MPPYGTLFVASSPAAAVCAAITQPYLVRMELARPASLLLLIHVHETAVQFNDCSVADSWEETYQFLPGSFGRK